MTNIPGLSFCSNDESGTILELQSFTGKISIPESHRYGHCRQLSDFPLVGNIHIVGQHSVIYKCREERTNQIFALKLFKIAEDSNVGVPSSVLSEINILKHLKNHPNIINFHGAVAGVELDRNYLVLDYCEFSLKELLKRNVEAIFDRAMVKFIMYQIMLGLAFIHDGMIVHRNICSKNIMFTRGGVLKIGGFRTARFFNTEHRTPGLTELNYRAPELILSPTQYKPVGDMWSAGCIFAELLLKRPLFSGTSELELLKSMFLYLGTPTERIWPGCTELFSNGKLEEAEFAFKHEMQFNQMNDTFANETVECQMLLQDLLNYYPHFRVTSKYLLLHQSPYFKENPKGATSEDLAKVIQSIAPEV